MTISLEQFIAAELERSGRSVYTLDDVERLVAEWRVAKIEAAAAMSDEAIDELLGQSRRRQAQETTHG